MITSSKLSALLVGAALAAAMGGCKKHAEDIPPAPVTTPTAPTPTTATPPAASEPAPVTPPPATPAPDTTPPPAGSTTPGTSGTSGTQGTTGAGQPPSTAPDRIDQREPQRDRRPTY